MSRQRRLLSLAVLTLAAIASLATSQAQGISRQSVGQAFANPESPVIDGSLEMFIPDVGTLSNPIEVWVTIGPRALGGGTAIGPFEGRLAVAEDELGPWQGMPIATTVYTSSLCERIGTCRVPFRFQLRTAPTDQMGGVYLPWHINAFFAGYVETAAVQVSAASIGPTATAIAFLGGLIGLAFGVAVVLLARRNKLRERVLLRIAPIAGAVLALAVLAEGVALEHLPSLVLIMGAITFSPLLNLLREADGDARGECLAVGLLAAPILLGLTNDQGIFRIIDVLVLFVAIGLLLPVGAALLLTTREQPAQKPADRPKEWRTVVILAAFLAALIWIWTLVVAGGGTDYAFWYVAIPLFTFALLAWGLWRWWDTSAGGLLALTGLLLPLASVLGFFAANFRYMFAENHTPVAVFPSLVVIFVGGIALTVLTLRSWGGRRVLKERV